MINEKLLNPKSIVVIGGSNSINTLGGRVLKNLIDHNFKGTLFSVNPKEEIVQNLPCYRDVSEIPNVDLAIIAIAAKYVLKTVQILAQQKNTRGFIIFSAGFSEQDENGKILEKQLVEEINKVGGSLLGPNNIGLINQNFAGVFTTPIPILASKGVDFISGSGATAVFIIEAALSSGLTFSSIYSVGNSAQLGIEDILEHLDISFEPEKSSRIKMLYIESISNPQKFLKHSLSLKKKGCFITAIKAGSSNEGSRAASSHTGALATSDVAVSALFEKAGIIRCYGRNELINVAKLFNYKILQGKNIAIITHAGGPAVMLTDELSKQNFKIPEINTKKSKELLQQLFPGSSTSNPIDFLATGTAEQLATIIEYCEKDFDTIDAIVVIFGSPGLFRVDEVYDVLDEKIRNCSKPIFPILPSVENVKEEIQNFIAKGNTCFFDEVDFARALGKIYNQKPLFENSSFTVNEHTKNKIRKIIDKNTNGYLNPDDTYTILNEAEIPLVAQQLCTTKEECFNTMNKIPFPWVMKVVGPVHKSDVGGIFLNIESLKMVEEHFEKLIKIKNAHGVLIQPMKKGIELFIGIKKESQFGHLLMCGLGGIYIEIFKDVISALTPVTKNEALNMIESLKSYKILKGVRNQQGINIDKFAEIVEKVSKLVAIVPEIIELDLNPLLASENEILAVDARIRIEK